MGACEEDSAKHAPHKPEAVEVLLASYQKQLADLTAKVSQLETRLELREKQPRRSDSMISQDSAGRATSPSLGPQEPPPPIAMDASRVVMHEIVLP
eukprot:CAMPEP_0206147466 /NCGR_PEP_ID=MMETSP1473-20131121/33521_1 /ASSEMBLY_ACC=CAM_ASM_001109 /TAXON_ID=1461547 /ORGANISM="Stichococcus sp, Strain RCC1054" /LENGTH=95 /DNA_ID=CAMNT_0053544397 /DNA_START=156 /DNA_END=439 /DNA_ORIENTATION=-